MELSERYPFGRSRIEGTIYAINKAKGYGFISCDKIPFTRIYFHWTNLIIETINFAEIKRGDPVDFELEKKEDGTYRAIKVDVLEREKKTETKADTAS